MCIKLKNFMLSEIEMQNICIVWLHLYEMSRKDKSIKIESRLAVPWGWGMGWLQMGTRGLFGVVEWF